MKEFYLYNKLEEVFNILYYLVNMVCDTPKRLDKNEYCYFSGLRICYKATLAQKQFFYYKTLCLWVYIRHKYMVLWCLLLHFLLEIVHTDQPTNLVCVEESNH